MFTLFLSIRCSKRSNGPSNTCNFTLIPIIFPTSAYTHFNRTLYCNENLQQMQYFYLYLIRKIVYNNKITVKKGSFYENHLYDSGNCAQADKG